ncbi:hypothetical protein NHX12_024250 [Muraenolepis orangiensis]|uniref:Zinc fingers and homeoboxes 2 n=1 Tax=Muraenolepis orangiensis TaxID=630683 RepID=A0A9Q0EM02_9TELE|nr:hypothetical protein NHX12_024250 [Muraenolepis orangiensis]
MSSRRKSSTPCMVLPNHPSEEEVPAEEVPMSVEDGRPGPLRSPDPGEDNPERPLQQQEEDKEQVWAPGDHEARGYVCKYCSFSTRLLAAFKEHVDTLHPSVILNPVYLCAVCNFSTDKLDSLTNHNEAQHPGETGFRFKRVTADHRTVLEQTIKGLEERALPPRVPVRSNGVLQKDQMAAVSLNGTVYLPEAASQCSHVSPLLRRPPNFSSVPKMAVPLNTSKYNSSLDTNTTLMSSFNKFPYPTHAELSWLTASSKHPEEQIKVWFTTQRLKQGITWSPEEVEEARKKMFNGSIPPAHHTFTAPPSVSPSSSPGVSMCSGYVLVRPLAEQAESKRPIMAVAPHSGGPKDKGLMAPPPPPPPLKDRPHFPMEMKRPAATPLVTADAKRKHPGVAVGFTPLLTRPYGAPPPPIVAPPYKNYLLPHPSSLLSRDKHAIAHASSASAQTRRPSIIQPPRASRPPAQPSAFSYELKEQRGLEPRASCPRGDKVLTPLGEANGFPRDLNLHNSLLQVNGLGGVCTVPNQFPLLERMKGKTSEQLKVLEETFLRNSFPAQGDVDTLAATTRLSRQEIRSWFLERRALRDNLEQALLGSTGPKKMAGHLNGIHKPKRSSPPAPVSRAPPPPIVAPSAPQSGSGPPDWAPTRWPSSEEMSQLEARTGLPRSHLVRWFTDSRLTLKTSGPELSPLFHKMGGPGGPGPIGGQQAGRSPPLLPENVPTVLQRCREGGANASRIAENYASSLGSQQHQDWFSSRLRQKALMDMKSGGEGEGEGEEEEEEEEEEEVLGRC